MFKNAIAPIQAWLLSQGRCVACGMPLSKGKQKKRKNGSIQVTCSCGRIFIASNLKNPSDSRLKLEAGSFIKDSKKKTYRRALLKEVE